MLKASILSADRANKAKPLTRLGSLEPKNYQFSYSEILTITNNFERVIGKGGFGTVYHGYLNDTQVAVKMLSPTSAQGNKEFQAEVVIFLVDSIFNKCSLEYKFFFLVFF